MSLSGNLQTPRDGRFARRCWSVLVPALVAWATGCYPATREPSPVISMPRAFSSGGAEDTPVAWWKTFADPSLDGLVETALGGNLDLRAAWDRLRRARAVVHAGRAGLLPSLTGTGSGGRSVTSPDRGDRVYATEYSLGLSASYELDLWGRVRSGYDAAALDAAARAEDVRAGAISLSGRVAATWYLIVELRRQLDLLDRQAETNRALVDLVTLKFRKGDVSATDVLQQRQVLERTRGRKEQTAARLDVAAHALAVLLGREPVAYRPPKDRGFPVIAGLPRTGVPADRLRDRPDIRAAALRVRAADTRTAAAIAEKYPRITITADGRTTAERIRDLLDNWMAEVVAAISAPLFDAGLREAEVERSRAAAAELLHRYSGVLLSALEEVENALAEESRRRDYLQSLERQLRLSDESMTQIRKNYMKGTTEYIRFLAALQSHQQLESTVIQARRELIDARIALYRSLGCGWPLAAPRHPPRRVTGPLQRVGDLLTGGGDNRKEDEEETR